ncbi:MAG: hypothetical protein JWQ83_1928, partial [Lacunisphaera sp.]|nr:hypothetical protein [Lacunisphaera sp.]
MPQPLRVLMVEDNPADADLALLALRDAGFEPTWERVDTEAAYLARLDGKLDLVLSDFAMPQFNGIRALELLQQSGLDVPFILVSGTIGEDIAVEAIRKGATDYLLKDRLARLGPAVTHALAETKLRGERRQAEESLRIAQGQLGQLLEHSPAVLYWLKLSGDKIIPHLISENITLLLGFTAAEAAAHEWWVGQLHPDDRELATRSLAETIGTGASRTEYRLRHKDGRYRWVEDIRRLIRDAAGMPVELIGVWTDITERRRAEEIVHQASGHLSRDRKKQVGLEMVVLVVSAAIFYVLAAQSNWFEAATRWVLANDVDQLDEVAFTMVFLVMGLAVFAFRRWRETESELTTHQQARAALALLHDELDRQVRQRTEELNKANQALRREAADRILAAEALRESEMRFRELAENIQEVFWVSDPKKTEKLYISPAYEKIWGRTCQSLYESPHLWLEAIRPEDRDRVIRASETKQTRGTYDEEYRIIQPDGTERWIRDRAFPVREARGAIKRWVGVAEDITEYRTMEEQFRQTQKMEAIGTLAGGIAHDFNNILAAINGYAELSRMSLKGNPEVREYLGAVLQASSRAAGLVRQILTFSRQQPLKRLPVQLRPVVEETFKLLRATIPSTIEFDLVLAADAPVVLADTTQIHQILMNLGTNAWHAMQDGPGRLAVRLERFAVDAELAATAPRLRPGVYARLSVSDSGNGMDAATLRRIFEPFFTTKAPGEGTGLGLAVVHGIMDSHDGAVTVSSHPGAGTVFRLYFPATAAQATVAAVE